MNTNFDKEQNVIVLVGLYRTTKTCNLGYHFSKVVPNFVVAQSKILGAI